MSDTSNHVKETLNNTINKIHNIKNTEQSGGFNMFKTKDTFNNVIKNTKHSENVIINKYKNMFKVVKEFYVAYDEHINNLRKLDKYVNFNGMTSIFKNVINKHYLKHGNIDKSLPILFNNYLINGETSYKEFRRAHIMQQIHYVIETYFGDKGGMLNIKYMFIDVGSSNFILYLTNKNDKTENFKINHTDYLIDIQDTIDKIQHIIVIDKSKLKNKKEVLTFNNDDKNITSTDTLFSILIDAKKLSKIRVPSSSSSSSSQKTVKSKRNTSSKKQNNIRKALLTTDNNVSNVSKSKKYKRISNMNKFFNDVNSNNVSVKQKSVSLKREKPTRYQTPSEQKKQKDVAEQNTKQKEKEKTQYNDLEKNKQKLLEKPVGQQAPEQAPAQTYDANSECGVLKGWDACKEKQACFYKDGKCNTKPIKPQFGGPPGAPGAPGAPLQPFQPKPLFTPPPMGDI